MTDEQIQYDFEGVFQKLEGEWVVIIPRADRTDLMEMRSYNIVKVDKRDGSTVYVRLMDLVDSSIRYYRKETNRRDKGEAWTFKQIGTPKSESVQDVVKERDRKRALKAIKGACRREPIGLCDTIVYYHQRWLAGVSVVDSKKRALYWLGVALIEGVEKAREYAQDHDLDMDAAMKQAKGAS